MPPERPADYGPRPLDLDTPNAARLYDCFLGGAHNTATDRKVAKEFATMAPHWTLGARLNRSFLRHAVRFMTEQGIDQFLDLGSGIPTVGNVHEIAQQANPNARVVYVDNEPVAVAHARALLADDPNTAIVATDLRNPESVLNHPDTRALLDLTRPVGLLMLAVFHFVSEQDDPTRIVAGYASAVPEGSYLAISHYSQDGYDEAKAERAGLALKSYRRSVTPIYARSRADLARLLSGQEIVPPGIVWTPTWRPDSSEPALCEPADAEIIAAVARIVH
jgi:hypothetical protein